MNNNQQMLEYLLSILIMKSSTIASEVHVGIFINPSLSLL